MPGNKRPTKNAVKREVAGHWLFKKNIGKNKAFRLKLKYAEKMLAKMLVRESGASKAAGRLGLMPISRRNEMIRNMKNLTEVEINPENKQITNTLKRIRISMQRLNALFRFTTMN